MPINDLIIKKEDSLGTYIRKIIQNSKNHGWHERERGIDEIVCLLQTEVSEFFEEFREKSPQKIYFETAGKLQEIDLLTKKEQNEILKPTEVTIDIDWIRTHKPGGYAIELADLVIRLLDAEDIFKNYFEVSKEDSYFEAMIPIKSTYILSNSLFKNIRRLSQFIEEENFLHAFCYCFELANEYDFGLLKAIRIKHIYNLTRPYLHGKRF